MTKNGNTLRWRMGQVEDHTKNMDGKIDKILQNDLPHIQQQVTKNGTTIKVSSAINVGAIIIGLLIAKFLI